MIYDKIERNYIAIIQNKRKDFFSVCIKALLRPISFVFSTGVFFRNLIYDLNIISPHKTDIPVVISIGNLVLGGTGKTPVTLLLAKELSESFPLAIITRGYRSQAEKINTSLLISKGNGPEYPAKICGDEPFLIAENVSDAYVIAGKNKRRSANIAASFKPKIMIVDDGMQHRQLHRTHEIVVINAKDPFGQNFLFPRGFLREHVSSLKRAHLVILNHIQSQQQFKELSMEISKWTTAPVIASKVRIHSIVNLEDNSILTVKGKKIGVFCGIASPESLEESLLQLDFEIVDRLIIRDHGEFKEEQLKEFANKCKKNNAEFLICSEKDKVKLLKSFTLAIPIAWVKIELDIVEGFSLWKDFIDNIKKFAALQTKE